VFSLSPGRATKGMAEGDVHTVYEDGVWKNKIEGGKRASNTAIRRQDAISAGRRMAKERRVDHVIHTPGGEVEARNPARR